MVVRTVDGVFFGGHGGVFAGGGGVSYLGGHVLGSGCVRVEASSGHRAHRERTGSEVACTRRAYDVGEGAEVSAPTRGGQRRGYVGRRWCYNQLGFFGRRARRFSWL